MRVKLADLKDNMRIDRYAVFDDKAKARMDKYAAFKELIETRLEEIEFMCIHGAL